MHLERITFPEHPLFQQAMALYQLSFPPHEQREMPSQQAIMRHPAYHFDAIWQDGIFIGEALSWKIGDFRYIEHFCILPEMRNKRYGQRALALLLQAHPLMLEIDPPIDEISLRRKGFYECCGFVANPFPHVHPPYHPGNHGHALVVMSAPAPLTQKDYDAFNRYLQDEIMKDAF